MNTRARNAVLFLWIRVQIHTLPLIVFCLFFVLYSKYILWFLIKHLSPRFCFWFYECNFWTKNDRVYVTPFQSLFCFHSFTCSHNQTISTHSSQVAKSEVQLWTRVMTHANSVHTMRWRNTIYITPIVVTQCNLQCTPCGDAK